MSHWPGDWRTAAFGINQDQIIYASLSITYKSDCASDRTGPKLAFITAAAACRQARHKDDNRDTAKKSRPPVEFW